MHDLKVLASWLDSNEPSYEMLTPSSLPDPCFVLDGREQVSFSTNNYLALANSPRVKARARGARPLRRGQL